MLQTKKKVSLKKESAVKKSTKPLMKKGGSVNKKMC